MANSVFFVHHFQAGLYEILHIDKLCEAAAVAGEDDGAIGSQTIPEKGFAVKVIAYTVYEGRPQGDNGQAYALMETNKARSLIALLRVYSSGASSGASASLHDD